MSRVSRYLAVGNLDGTCYVVWPGPTVICSTHDHSSLTVPQNRFIRACASAGPQRESRHRTDRSAPRYHSRPAPVVDRSTARWACAFRGSAGCPWRASPRTDPNLDAPGECGCSGRAVSLCAVAPEPLGSSSPFCPAGPSLSTKAGRGSVLPVWLVRDLARLDSTPIDMPSIPRFRAAIIVRSQYAPGIEFRVFQTAGSEGLTP